MTINSAAVNKMPINPVAMNTPKLGADDLDIKFFKKIIPKVNTSDEDPPNSRIESFKF